MRENNSIHDHFTVISHTGGARTSRVVIAGSCADAAETHLQHYPGEVIIRVVQATASVKLTA